ncbi:MAG: acyl-CoA dehydrogenase [Oligoflexales bacterium]
MSLPLSTAEVVCYFAITALFLGFFSAPLFLWSIAVAAVASQFELTPVAWGLLGAFLLVFNIPVLRQKVVSKHLLGLLKKLNVMPAISETEKTALEAGTTWVDKELFSGKPNFRSILEEPYKKVSGEELEFLNGPVEELCRNVSDWDVYQQKELPDHVWAFLKQKRFFGMIIPKKYGGLEFSAVAHSEVVAKLSAHSTALGVTVMVPNSLGPAELLIHYGTEEQKNYYLPRLARGEEIPCFALTEPEAGSDAGSISSHGEVFKGDDGKLYIKLNWEKRYITLAAVSTVIGLAIKLRDPNKLLGPKRKEGITCLLVPAKTPGVVLGRRHDPMGVPFYNCPTWGKDVVVSIDNIIGGADGAGRGWLMLMECLAAGRSISLPAQTTGIAKMLSRVTSAYASVRKQFGVSIGQFEGIEEPLARVFGLTYILESSRLFTVNAVDKGVKPSVVSAIAKYNSTELGRKVINDGMDILGGAAISRGPRNPIANSYMATPISITVEGANILTRCMIVFGQGAIRCHPFAYNELKSIEENNVPDFDRAFWGHVGFTIRNLCRSIVLSVTRGYFASVPGGYEAKYYRKLSWASASFAVMADMALGALGGSLKFREKITGRFADILSWMYLGTATLRRFREEGCKKEHRIYLDWSMQYALNQIQEAFDGLYANFPLKGLRWFFAGPIYFWSRMNRIGHLPSDRLGERVAKSFLQPSATRDYLTPGVYISTDVSRGIARYEHAFRLMHETSRIHKAISKAYKQKIIQKGPTMTMIKAALEANIITQNEANQAIKAEEAIHEAISVDSFSLDEYMKIGVTPIPKPQKVAAVM